jgi:hypothetical protein
MVAAGDAVDIIEESLRRIVAAYGVAGLQIALLPTSLFVQTGAGDRADREPGMARPRRRLSSAADVRVAGTDHRSRRADRWPGPVAPADAGRGSPRPRSAFSSACSNWPGSRR